MKKKVIRIGDLVMEVPSGWKQLTLESDEEKFPVTFADPKNGVGALQVTVAEYETGLSPDFSLKSLQELADEFADSQGLGSFLREDVLELTNLVLQRVFHVGEDLIQVSYLTNGKSIALVTYVCEWVAKEKEKAEIAGIIKSMRFEHI